MNEITREAIEAAATKFLETQEKIKEINKELGECGDLIVSTCDLAKEMQMTSKAFDEAAELLGADVTKNDDWSELFPKLGEKHFDYETHGKTLRIIALYDK